jgi:hypothetical protein
MRSRMLAGSKLLIFLFLRVFRNHDGEIFAGSGKSPLNAKIVEGVALLGACADYGDY